MVKKIVRDVLFLGQKSEPATKQDFPVGQDLQDTLRANQDRCVGMAANMIGIRKRVIIVNMGFIGGPPRRNHNLTGSLTSGVVCPQVWTNYPRGRGRRGRGREVETA